jgi:DNA-binding HxlR family transcriptional regulator
VRTEYALSPIGASLAPLSDSMVAWGTGYQRLVNEE